jgi:hypothetical protein
MSLLSSPLAVEAEPVVGRRALVTVGPSLLAVTAAD